MKQIKLLMLTLCLGFFGATNAQLESTIEYVATYTWTGATASTLWTNTANWTVTSNAPGGIVVPGFPNVTNVAGLTHIHNVVIPTNVNNRYPTLRNISIAGTPLGQVPNVTVSDLDIQTGATLNLGGNSLTINGFISGAGSLIGGLAPGQQTLTAKLTVDRADQISFYTDAQAMNAKYPDLNLTYFEDFEDGPFGALIPGNGGGALFTFTNLNPNGFVLSALARSAGTDVEVANGLFVAEAGVPDPLQPLDPNVATASLSTVTETDLIELLFAGGSPVYAFSAFFSITDLDFNPLELGDLVDITDDQGNVIGQEATVTNDGLITVLTQDGNTFDYTFNATGEQVGFVTNSPIVSVTVESEVFVIDAQTVGFSTIDNIRIGTRVKTGGLNFSQTTGQNQLLSLSYNLASAAGNIDELTLNNNLEVFGAVQPLSGTLRVTPLLTSDANLTLKSTDTKTAEVMSHTNVANIVGTTRVERNIPKVDNAGLSPVDRNKGWRFLGLPYSTSTTIGSLSGINYSLQYPTLMEFVDVLNTNSEYGSGGARNNGYSEFTLPGQSIASLQGLAAWIYDEANGSSAVSGTLSASQKLVTTGTLLETGNDVIKGLSFQQGSRTLENTGWNLISNPFASTINWDDASIIKTSIDGTIYRWNPRLGTWSTWNSNTQAGTGGDPAVDPENIADFRIESGSSFFVKANATGAQITFTQASKLFNQVSDLNQFSKNNSKLNIAQVSAANKSSKTNKSALRLLVSGPGHPTPADALLSLNMDDATAGFDSKYDAYFRGRSAGAAVSINEKSTKMVMQFDRPIAENGKEKRYYPLTVTVPSVGKTKLDINVEGAWNSLNKVYLIDKKEGKTIQLSGNKLSYEFNMTTKEESDRFMLAINHVNVADKSGITTTDVRVMNNPVRSNVIDAIIAHPTAKAKNYSIVNGSGATLNSGSIQDNNSVQHQLGFGKSNANGVMYLKVNFENGDSKTVKFIKL